MVEVVTFGEPLSFMAEILRANGGVITIQSIIQAGFRILGSSEEPVGRFWQNDYDSTSEIPLLPIRIRLAL